MNMVRLKISNKILGNGHGLTLNDASWNASEWNEISSDYDDELIKYASKPAATT